MALCTSGRGFRGNTCPTMTRRQAAHQALSLQSRPTRLGTAQLTTSVVRASLVNAKISTPTSLAPSSASGTTVQVHNTAGKPRDRRKQLGFLSRENYYVSDPPVRAGFSIFCQTKIPLSSIAKPGSEGSVQS